MLCYFRVKYASYHGWIWSSDRFISPFNLLEYQIDNLSHFVSQKTLKWHLGTFFRMDDDTSVQFWNKFPKKEIFKKIFPSIVRTVHLSKLLMHVGLTPRSIFIGTRSKWNRKFARGRRNFILTVPCERACSNYRTISKN